MPYLNLNCFLVECNEFRHLLKNGVFITDPYKIEYR